MSDSQFNLSEIQARVEKRIQARAKFFSDLTRYIGINIVVWAIWIYSGGGFPWPLFVTVFLGINVIKKGFSTFVGGNLMDNMRDREMEREIAKTRQYMGNTMGEKPKRGYIDSSDEMLTEKPKRGTVHLTDDGEMIYDDPKQSTSSGKQS